MIEMLRYDQLAEALSRLGYVQDAADCGEPIDAEHLAAYMGELKRRALAPVREWMRGITEQAPPTGN